MKKKYLAISSIFLLFLFGGCEDEQLLLGNVISVKINGVSSQPANGLNEIEIVGHIPVDSDRDKRSIEFSTDIGTFNNNTKTITVVADAAGDAKAYLKSTAVGTATIKATVKTFVASVQANFSYANGISFENSTIESLVADNISVLKLTAQIDPSTPVGKRDVVFVTDLGSFTNNAASITVEASADGKASAYFKSGSVGQANIKATNQGLNALKMVNLSSSGAVNLVNAATENLVADGYTLLKLTAHIDPNVEPSKRNITFKTDLGSFTNNEKTVIVPIDMAGNANAYIKGDVVGTATITVTGSSTLTATKVVVFTQPTADQIFKIETVTDNVASDGVSTIMIPVLMNKDLPALAKKVTFSANVGTFQVASPAVISADADGKLTGYLKHTVPGPVYVSLSAGGVTRNLTVNFVKANPDFILLTGNVSLAHGLNNSLSLAISLKRSIGNPNADFLFDYKATDDSGAEIGIFSNGSASNASGGATVSFTAGETTYRGNVLITVSLRSNPAIKASHNLIIN